MQVAQTCSLELLRKLMHTLREGPDHTRHGEISTALTAASAAVACEGATARAFIGDLLSLLHDGELRATSPPSPNLRVLALPLPGLPRPYIVISAIDVSVLLNPRA
jgi:hypothetical protein